MSNISLTDTHAHIHFSPLLDEVEAVVERAKNAGVDRIVTIGIDYKDSKQAIAVAERFDNVFATVGIHPHDAMNYKTSDYDKFKKLADHAKVIAIGEIGLDFFKDYAPRDIQQVVFESMLELSIELELPVVIHNRDSGVKCREVMNSYLGHGNSKGGILHCFNGDQDILHWALEHGFCISYAGQVTYKSAQEIRDALKITPIDRILIETDCPYLSPVPLRGKQNEPANIVHTFEFIANELGLDKEKFAKQLESNYTSLFFSKL